MPPDGTLSWHINDRVERYLPGEDKIMAVEREDLQRVTPEAEAFVRGLIDVVAHQRLPDLFGREHPDALDRVPARNGVSVLVVRRSGLQEDGLVALMKYRLAQYLADHFVDPQMISGP